jgi:hypothetical protein
VTGDDVLAAAELCRTMLEPALAADWAVPVPGLDFTVASAVAHAAEAPLWYSLDIWSGQEDAAFDVKVGPDAPNERLVASLVASACALAAGADAAPAGTRGFHPFGSPDPAAFAAMACDELLVHGDDAARGLGRARPGLRPGPRPGLGGPGTPLSWHVVGPGEDPWRVLLWASGRTDLEGRPRQVGWRWQRAPLAEWDGTRP